MAKVKDTESFIAAAREIHGGRYDYSRTVFTKSNRKITIVCRVCGPFELAQAESHYRKSKSCGCKTCEKKGALRRSGRFHLCKRCKGWAKYRDQKGYCEKCKEVASNERKRDRIERGKIVCRCCGVSFHGDKRRVYCSLKCFAKSNKGVWRVEVNCSICGKSTTRKKSAMHKKVGCSNECLRVLVSRQQAEKNELKARLCIRCDSVLDRSKKKFCADCEQERIRQPKSEWLCCIDRSIASLNSRTHAATIIGWERKCENVISGLRTRKIGSNNKSKAREWEWKSRMQVAWKQLDAKQKRRNQNPWSKKAESVACNWARKVRQ